MPELITIPLRQDESDLLEEAAKRSRLTLVQWAKVTLLRAAGAPSLSGPAGKVEPHS